MTSTRIQDDYLTIQETAEALGYKSSRTISNRICRKLPVPAYVKVPGSRTIKFLRRDVEAFLQSCRIEPMTVSKSSQ